MTLQKAANQHVPYNELGLAFVYDRNHDWHGRKGYYDKWRVNKLEIQDLILKKTEIHQMMENSYLNHTRSGV